MLSNRPYRIPLAGALFAGLLATAHAQQVVGDSACARHAVDIEAFATCDGDRVTKPEGADARRDAPDRRAAAMSSAKDARLARPATIARDDTERPTFVPAARSR